jgi:hypothetical protein
LFNCHVPRVHNRKILIENVKYRGKVDFFFISHHNIFFNNKYLDILKRIILSNTKKGKTTNTYIFTLIPIFISKKNKIGMSTKQTKLVVIQEAPSPILSEFSFILQLLQ